MSEVGVTRSLTIMMPPVPQAGRGSLAGRILLVVGAAALLAGVPGLYKAGTLDITTVNQLGRFLCLSIAALGIDLVWGYAGALTLCQAMFFVFGGYAIGMHMALHGPLDPDGLPKCLSVVLSNVGHNTLPWFWRPFRTLSAALFLGVALPGVFALIFGYFTFRSRVRGVYFSIITQATTFAVAMVFRKNEMCLCGTNGLTNFTTLAGFDLQNTATKLGLYELSALALVLIYLLCAFIVRSRLGRLLIAVRDNESRLRFAGYQPVLFKVFVFTLGAVIAGIGGMLYTPQNGIITPFKMDPVVSVMMVAYVAVGGRGTLSGAVLGTIIVSYLESYLTSNYPVIWMYVLGGLFIGITLAVPDGVVGAWRQFLTWLADRRIAGLRTQMATARAELSAAAPPPVDGPAAPRPPAEVHR